MLRIRGEAQTAINILSKQMRCHAEKTNQAKGKDEDDEVGGEVRGKMEELMANGECRDEARHSTARYRICS